MTTIQIPRIENMEICVDERPNHVIRDTITPKADEIPTNQRDQDAPRKRKKLNKQVKINLIARGTKLAPLVSESNRTILTSENRIRAIATILVFCSPDMVLWLWFLFSAER